MKIGYIARYNLELNPHLTEKFKFKECTFTRRISSRGDRVYSKMLMFPVDYEEIVDNANLIRGDSGLMLVGEPFLLDDELRKKMSALGGVGKQRGRESVQLLCRAAEGG